jgi:DNA-binding MarR family transcriptional regulator
VAEGLDTPGPKVYLHVVAGGDIDQFRETQQCMCFNLRRAARIMTQHYERYLRPVGLRATQFTLLAALAQADPMPMHRLAAALGLERTTLTRNLSRLESQGWVTVEEKGDRRIHMIAITELGRDVAQAALPAWREAHAAAGAVLAELRAPQPG